MSDYKNWKKMADIRDRAMSDALNEKFDQILHRAEMASRSWAILRADRRAAHRSLVIESQFVQYRAMSTVTIFSIWPPLNQFFKETDRDENRQ